MKKYFFIVSSTLFFSSAIAQNVGINPTGASPTASAGLDVDFTNKGILIPRLALTQTSSSSPVITPATSLVVYNTASVNDVTPGFYYWDGTQWLRLINGTGNGAAWMTNGNAASGSDFLGTTSNFPLVVKTNNSEQLRILNTGTLKITGTAMTSPGIWMSGTVVAAAGTAYGILSRGTLTASVNNDAFLPFSNYLGTVNTGAGLTGLTFYGGHFDGSSWSKTGSGTIDNGYGIYVTAPVIATSNYAGIFTGGNVGIGTTTPLGTLHVAGSSVNYVDRASNLSNEGACFIFRKARGTIAAPAALQNGDEMAKWLCGGFDGTSYLFTGGISAVVNGAVAAGTIPTDLVFGVNNVQMGNPITNEAMRITYGKNVGIGTTTPASKLDVVGTAPSGSFIVRVTNNTPDGEYLAGINFLGNEGISLRQDASGHSVLAVCNNAGTRNIQMSSTVESYINSGGNFGLSTTTPTALLDINGSTGYNQLRMRTSFTPSSSADASGNIGDIAWDSNYIYIKTAAGWKRTALSSF